MQRTRLHEHAGDDALADVDVVVLVFEVGRDKRQAEPHEDALELCPAASMPGRTAQHTHTRTHTHTQHTHTRTHTHTHTYTHTRARARESIFDTTARHE